VSVRTDDGEILAEEGRGIGVATNNVAEYTAAVEGLKLCKRLGASRVLLRSDSRLLVEQLSGRFRVKNPTLIRLHQEVRRLASEFDQVRYQHVPREQNKDADRMANVGVDEWLAGKGRDWRPPPPNPGLF
jgi:ribonuclease HI